MKAIIFFALLTLSVYPLCNRNGILETGEQCDPMISLPPCSHSCQLTCGNSKLDRSAGEQCDASDPDPHPPQGPCSNLCQYCGNGVWETNSIPGGIYSYALGFEDCDPTAPNNPAPCNDLCELTCGDGNIDILLGQDCDPEHDPSTPCDEVTCKFLCGNGILDPSQICDPEPQCMDDCTFCGNGIVQTVYEQCDSSDPNNVIPCHEDFTSTCNNGILDAGQQCDGVLPNGYPCDTITCKLLCGNGQIDLGEECDPSSSELADRGINCSPVTCQQRCGNGIIDASQICDNSSPSNTFPCDPETCTFLCGNGAIDDYLGLNPVQTCDYNLSPWTSATCDPNYCLIVGGCGDGIVRGDQECQRPFSGSEGGCDTNCLMVICGNGRKQGDQQCDDGNLFDNDFCNNYCQETTIIDRCGNGILDSGQQCDHLLTPTFCTLNCLVNLPGCGNGQLDATQQCDDSNNLNGDGCSAFCFLQQNQPCSRSVGCEPCGNGVIDVSEGENCDDGNRLGNDGCSQTCQIERPIKCGDNFLDSDQECDDGNSQNGDGCSVICEIEDGYVCLKQLSYSVCSKCGNGRYDQNEECDDGNFDDNDGCELCQIIKDWECSVEYPTMCTPIINYCGDGKWNPEKEECDDGDNISSNGCTRYCTVTFGYLCEHQEGHPSICKKIYNKVCGDGNKDQFQQCDDGNLAANDGCSISCKIQPGFQCFHPPAGPTQCYPKQYCGNGRHQPKQLEECDDHNLISGDGCSSNCLIQQGFSCFQKFNGTSGCMPKDPSLNNPDPSPIQFCGDGRYNPSTQECDDWNNINTDGCSSSCKIQTFFECTQSPGKKSICEQFYFPPVCGDSKLDPYNQQCDDGNIYKGDGCDDYCRVESGYRCNFWGCKKLCGNGMIDKQEECDDFNELNYDGCSHLCQIEPGFSCVVSGWHSFCRQTCGNSMFQPEAKEQCDDGDRISGDGCSVNCLIQSGFYCPYNVMMDRSICLSSDVRTCGNSLWELEFQECDDGNKLNNDGCSEFCRFEDPSKFSCTNRIAGLTVCKQIQFCQNGYPLPLTPLSLQTLAFLRQTQFGGVNSVADVVRLILIKQGNKRVINESVANILGIIFSLSKCTQQWQTIQNIAYNCISNYPHYHQ